MGRRVAWRRRPCGAQHGPDGEGQGDDAGQHVPVGVDHPGPVEAARHFLAIGHADQGAGIDLEPLPDQIEDHGGGQRGGADDAQDQPGHEAADGELDRIGRERRKHRQRHGHDEERAAQQDVVQPYWYRHRRGPHREGRHRHLRLGRASNIYIVEFTRLSRIMTATRTHVTRHEKGGPRQGAALSLKPGIAYWMTISTRRFCGSRTPSAVWTRRPASPRPITVIACAGTPSRTRASFTALARRSDSAML